MDIFWKGVLIMSGKIKNQVGNTITSIETSGWSTAVMAVVSNTANSNFSIDVCNFKQPLKPTANRVIVLAKPTDCFKKQQISKKSYFRNFTNMRG